ncbi:MAG: hypothetical protein ACK5K7_07490 [Bacilli bacterium]
MAVKIIKQSNKKLNYIMLDFYHLIILSVFTFLYFAIILIGDYSISFMKIATTYLILVFFYYILFAKFDGENNIILNIIRKLKYITKKKYIIKEKGEYDLW